MSRYLTFVTSMFLKWWPFYSVIWHFLTVCGNRKVKYLFNLNFFCKIDLANVDQRVKLYLKQYSKSRFLAVSFGSRATHCAFLRLEVRSYGHEVDAHGAV